ncbi:hypothetical protein FRC12_024838 [Ceratobasidium sp. 428]|nr:hypothetical protein FRC12_024838 [Ceratobasidium sp. 428]
MLGRSGQPAYTRGLKRPHSRAYRHQHRYPNDPERYLGYISWIERKMKAGIAGLPAQEVNDNIPGVTVLDPLAHTAQPDLGKRKLPAIILSRYMLI